MRSIGIVAGVLVAMATVWVGYKSTRHSGFDDGWEAGRCYDWKQMNQMGPVLRFRPQQDCRHGARVIRALMRYRRQVER
jgi:hypothetical protein